MDLFLGLAGKLTSLTSMESILERTCFRHFSSVCGLFALLFPIIRHHALLIFHTVMEARATLFHEIRRNCVVLSSKRILVTVATHLRDSFLAQSESSTLIFDH